MRWGESFLFGMSMNEKHTFKQTHKITHSWSVNYFSATFLFFTASTGWLFTSWLVSDSEYHIVCGGIERGFKTNQLRICAHLSGVTCWCPLLKVMYASRKLSNVLGSEPSREFSKAQSINSDNGNQSDCIFWVQWQRDNCPLLRTGNSGSINTVSSWMNLTYRSMAASSRLSELDESTAFPPWNVITFLGFIFFIKNTGCIFLIDRWPTVIPVSCPLVSPRHLFDTVRLASAWRQDKNRHPLAC